MNKNVQAQGEMDRVYERLMSLQNKIALLESEFQEGYWEAEVAGRFEKKLDNSGGHRESIMRSRLGRIREMRATVDEMRQDMVSLRARIALWRRQDQRDFRGAQAAHRCENMLDDNERLLGRLKLGFSLNWGGRPPKTTLDDVYEKMEGDPTFSEKQSVTLQLPWLPLETRLKFEHTVRGVELGAALFDTIVLTGSSAYEIQATTVEQYFRQAWIYSSTDLLKVLRLLVDNGIRSSRGKISSS